MPRKRQPVKVPTGTTYGQGQKLADAQRQQSLPGPGSTPQPSAPRTTAGGVATAPVQAPPTMAAALAAGAELAPPVGGGLSRPSDRPGEPVTAGLPMGPGAGPEALGLPLLPSEDAVLADLIVAYQQHPSPALAKLLEVVRARSMARARTLAAGRGATGRRPL